MRPLVFEEVVFVLVCVFVGFVWLELARTSGVLKHADSQGFSIRNFFGQEKRIDYARIHGPVLMRKGVLPRLSVRLTSERRRVLQLRYTLFLRNRTGEAGLIDKLESIVGIRLVAFGGEPRV